jgi:acetyl-CoA carboxylase carboxyltransferase component
MPTSDPSPPAASVEVASPLRGTVVEAVAAPGQNVAAGAVLVIIESMKLHHEVVAPIDMVVEAVLTSAGDAIDAGDVVCRGSALDGGVVDDYRTVPTDESDRADLDEVIERHRLVSDGARPDAVERRRSLGRRTARENIEDLLDAESLLEYGGLVIAAQRRRRDLDDLIARTPADGLVGGIGTINAEIFGPVAGRCVAMTYDYTVLAGTQGAMNHRKKDRLFEIADRQRLPVVLFAEGGGGRPGDTDISGVSGLDCRAFEWFARLSGRVPLVGIASGHCFAGNAALLGCCDVIIATRDANIGMGGPAMIEGGGLGVYAPTEIGPVSVQAANGVVDVVVGDEAEAVRVAQRYLSYFQGSLSDWEAGDPTMLRDVVPRDRLRAYDMHQALELLFDVGSVLELRDGFGRGMITALARLEGRPVGVIANDPTHLAGAIDADGADKAARFMQLCDAFGLALITMVDTPGMMVGPDAEESALVRHCSRLFVIGANLSIPIISVVVRKAYGLGAQAMMGGTTKGPIGCVAWPTGEFGGMGLEGAVRLGFRRELEAEADDDARRELFDKLVAHLYEQGRAVNVASYFEIDDAIDPATTRRWLCGLLETVPADVGAAVTETKRRPQVDTW